MRYWFLATGRGLFFTQNFPRGQGTLIKKFHIGKKAFCDRSDEELLKAYLKGQNTQIVLELMERYRSQILAFGFKYLRNEEEVRDFTNDVFLKLTEELSRRSIVNFQGWLSVFLRNMYYDRSRKEIVRRDYLSSLIPEQDLLFEDRVIREMDKAMLYRALDGLSSNERRCLKLLYLEDQSYQEVGDLTGWTFNQIRGFRERAVRKLRNMLIPEIRSSA